MQYKECSVCKEQKSTSLFNKNNRTKDGFTSACKVCRANARILARDKIKKQKAAWYSENKEQVLQRAKEDRASNPEKYKEKEARKYSKHRNKIIARVAEFQRKNPEINRAAGRKYRKANLDKQAAKTARRRARVRKATPKWAESEFEQLYIQEIYHLSQLHRELTKIEFHVDHIVPLVSKFVCGLHCFANLRLLTSEDNLKKHNKYWPDMWE